MHLDLVVHAHAAAFLGRDPWDVAHSADLLVDAHLTAWKCYQHQPVTPVMAPHIAEAEAWGVAIRPNGTGDSFAIGAPICANVAAVEALQPLDAAGMPRLETLLEATRRLVDEIPEGVTLPATGPLAMTAILLGRETLLELIENDPEGARDCLLAVVAKQLPWIREVAATNARLAIAEAGYTPETLSPETFAAVVEPALKAMSAEIRRLTGHRPAILVDGDTAPIVPSLCAAEPSMIVCPVATNRNRFMYAARPYRDIVVRVDLPREIWVQGDWHVVCDAIVDAAHAAHLHSEITLGSGPLPLHASSVLVVDARDFAMKMAPWLDRT